MVLLSEHSKTLMRQYNVRTCQLNQSTFADQLGSSGFMINSQLKKQLIDMATDQQLAGELPSKPCTV